MRLQDKLHTNNMKPDINYLMNMIQLEFNYYISSKVSVKIWDNIANFIYDNYTRNLAGIGIKITDCNNKMKLEILNELKR